MTKPFRTKFADADSVAGAAVGVVGDAVVPKPLRGATMFSGIGAPEIAMPWVSWKWCAEIEPFPSAVLAHRHTSPNLGDVTNASFIERAKGFGPIDLLVFGSPCQSFSVAGKRLGLDDPRGNLALIALGVVAQLRPTWFLFENVPGLLSSESGRDFGAFVGTVGQLGYGWAYRVLDAQYFGVPQRRRRVFLVGHSGDWRAPAAVLFEQESLRRDSPPSRETGEETAGTIGGGSGNRGWADDTDRAGAFVSMCLNAKGGAGRMDGESETFIPFHGAQITSAANRTDSKPGDPSPTLNGDARLMVAHTLRGEGFDAGEDGTGRGSPLVAFDWQGRNHAATEECSPTLRKMADGGSAHIAVSYALGSHAGCADGEVSNHSHDSGGPVGTNVSEELAYSLRSGRTQAVASAAVRRLTPREWERLMGFADDYTLVPYRGKLAADGPRYKAIGNSIAIPPLRWIGDRIRTLTGLANL